MKDPQNPEEWQHAANLAHAFLLIDAARLYGFITGGPEIDTDRCETIIERAQALGITPTDELIDPLLAELNGTGRLTADIRRCRVCGCTDDNCSGCVERTGEPCYWVSDAIDNCSACFYFDTSPDERPALPYGTPVACMFAREHRFRRAGSGRISDPPAINGERPLQRLP